MLTQAQLAAQGVEMTPHFAADGVSNLFKVPAGRFLGQHAHAIGHHSMLLLGRAILRTGDGSARELQAPATVYLPAHTIHEVEAVTEVLWACTWPDADALLAAQERGEVAA